MTHRYEEYVHHMPCMHDCDSLENAILFAWSALESGDAWPQRILDGEQTLWEQSGPLTSSASLKRFAAQNGIVLIEGG